MTKVLKSINTKTSTMAKDIESAQKTVNTAAYNKPKNYSRSFRESSTLDYEYQVAIVDLDFGLSRDAWLSHGFLWYAR